TRNIHQVFGHEIRDHGLRLFRGACEPIAEACGPQARIFARRETLVIDCRTEIQGYGIGDYRPWVPCCTQELPNQLVLTDRFRTSQVDRAVQRLRKGHIEQGLIDRNPVAAVRPIRTSSAKKGVFSPEQIQRLLDVAEGDWKGLILCGYFTGGRLVDVARLTWANIDLSEKTITFRLSQIEIATYSSIHSKRNLENLHRRFLNRNSVQRPI